ncbi:NADP-dependent malic enzyme-like [Solanum verrucosum]|uniref:NADP-dependent malic enzyme-like n=1 Tax=Solanum verrucosum TaxID=315347 RepID=UPI0020D170A7|nr:NADP-dependent malic enzyme-like [Solanum verrucosum]
MSILSRNRVVEIALSSSRNFQFQHHHQLVLHPPGFDMIRKVGHHALSRRGVFQGGNNSRAQSTALVAPADHPTQQGVSSGTGGDVYALLDLGAALSFVTPYIAVNFYGMGRPVWKLSLYTVFVGVRPSVCLPIAIDVGTNNEQLLKDEFYIGLRQKKATKKEYFNFLDEFMKVVKQNYSEKVLVQYEDFANHNAFELLVNYGTTHLVFNDDMQFLIPLMLQGTTVVVLAGLVASLKLLGGSLVEHTFLFFGAGEAGTGILELIALAISEKTNAPVEEARK